MKRVAQLFEITSNGDINLNVTRAFMGGNFDGENSTDELVDECVKEINEFDDFSFEKLGLKCCTKMAQLVYCIWRQIMLTCPVEKQEKTKQCEKLRTILRRHQED